MKLRVPIAACVLFLLWCLCFFLCATGAACFSGVPLEVPCSCASASLFSEPLWRRPVVVRSHVRRLRYVQTAARRNLHAGSGKSDSSGATGRARRRSDPRWLPACRPYARCKARYVLTAKPPEPQARRVRPHPTGYRSRATGWLQPGPPPAHGRHVPPRPACHPRRRDDSAHISRFDSGTAAMRC